MHGIPGSRKLKEGDLVSLDLGCVVDGFYGDSARTVAVGRVSAGGRAPDARDRGGAARRASRMCHPGKRVGDIGHAVQQHAEAHGYSVVPEFVGHGIGTSLHEDPQVPNYGPPGPPRAAGARHVPGHRAHGERWAGRRCRSWTTAGRR